ncbi:MAG: hypothetical protein ACYCWW_00150 [Deltaproteobacteria bacterium]
MRHLALILALVMQPWGTLEHTDRIVILGLPTSGKTWLAERLVAPAWRVVWFDPAGDYGKPGRVEVTPDELERWPRLVNDPHLRLVVTPQGETGRELAEDLTRVTNIVRKKGDLVFVADEVGDYRVYAEGRLGWLFRRGRHDGIATVLVSQVGTDIPLTCRKTASRVYCLAQHHPDELQKLAAIYGEAYAARVAAWQKYDPPIVWSMS